VVFEVLFGLRFLTINRLDKTLDISGAILVDKSGVNVIPAERLALLLALLLKVEEDTFLVDLKFSVGLFNGRHIEEILRHLTPLLFTLR
jgi:hypothetical protein